MRVVVFVVALVARGTTNLFGQCLKRTYLDRIQLHTRLDNIDGRKSTVRNGTTDTTGTIKKEEANQQKAYVVSL